MIKKKIPNPLKAVLFDMDGILYNSMPYHAASWKQALLHFGFTVNDEWVYMQEGRTGDGTIQLLYQGKYHRAATPEEVTDLYQYKANLFTSFPPADTIEGVTDFIQLIKSFGIQTGIVTGSGQITLIDKINHTFPNIFHKDHIVTAFDVQRGKPYPDPYLMGLKKLQITADEAIVIENAPLGIEAAKAAGIFTIAVNTGPLSDKILYDAGADLLFHNMKELSEHVADYFRHS